MAKPLCNVCELACAGPTGYPLIDLFVIVKSIFGGTKITHGFFQVLLSANSSSLIIKKRFIGLYTTLKGIHVNLCLSATIDLFANFSSTYRKIHVNFKLLRHLIIKETAQMKIPNIKLEFYFVTRSWLQEGQNGYFLYFLKVCKRNQEEAIVLQS